MNLLDSKKLTLLFIFLFIFDFFIWYTILIYAPNKNLELYFLDVGQGDSEFVILPNNIKILIDGGPNNKVVSQLDKILSPFDRYIDLIMLSHPQLDHFGGLVDVLKRYKVGAFVSNGRIHTIAAFLDLEKSLDGSNALRINLMAGDSISYQDNNLKIIAPNDDFIKSKELNDTVLVAFLESSGFKALFTGDIGFRVEKYLVDNFNMAADVLKVAHHGSKYSSSEEFLKAVNPKISIIEVGKNKYGHPTKDALDRLRAAGSDVFRTDYDGAIKLTVSGESINIFKSK